MSDPLVQFKNNIMHMLHNEQDFYKSCEQALFLFDITEPIFVGFDYAYKVVDLCKYYTDEIDNLLRAEPHHATEKKLNALRLRFARMSERFHRLQHASMAE